MLRGWHRTSSTPATASPSSAGGRSSTRPTSWSWSCRLVPSVRALPRVHRRGHRGRRCAERARRRGDVPSTRLPARVPSLRGARRHGHRVRGPAPAPAHLHAAGRAPLKVDPAARVIDDRVCLLADDGTPVDDLGPAHGRVLGLALDVGPRPSSWSSSTRFGRGHRGSRIREPAALRRQRRHGPNSRTTASTPASSAARFVARSTAELARLYAAGGRPPRGRRGRGGGQRDHARPGIRAGRRPHRALAVRSTTETAWPPGDRLDRGGAARPRAGVPRPSARTGLGRAAHRLPRGRGRRGRPRRMDGEAAGLPRMLWTSGRTRR